MKEVCHWKKTIVFGEKNETIEGFQDSILKKMFVDEAKNARIHGKMLPGF